MAVKGFEVLVKSSDESNIFKWGLNYPYFEKRGP